MVIKTVGMEVDLTIFLEIIVMEPLGPHTIGYQLRVEVVVSLHHILYCKNTINTHKTKTRGALSFAHFWTSTSVVTASLEQIIDV